MRVPENKFRVRQWWPHIVLGAWVLVAMLSCSGCSLIAPYENTAVRNTEYTWLGMHAIDTYQTATFKPCTREADPLAVKVYGTDQPSASRVVATNALLGYAHYRIGGWIDKRTEQAGADPDDESYRGWYLFRAAWHGAALFGTGYSVLHNATARYECGAN